MQNRYYSLDVFRGATIAFMILVNNPGNWNFIYAPLQHAPWHGCTPTDLVFPFFLFAVGNAMAFVVPKYQTNGHRPFIKKVISRTIIIFSTGVLLNWIPFFTWQNEVLVAKQWQNIRIMGVLQRIALCYFFAALIVYFLKKKWIIALSFSLLLLYWFITILSGSSPDPLSLQGYFGTRLDKLIIGESHMYKGEGVPFDPEGLAGTITATVQVIFGYICGMYIIQNGRSYKMLVNLFIAGSVLIFVGLMWDMVFPINKKIWSSSYVVYTTGIAIMIIGLLVYLFELKRLTSFWSRFFDVFGRNPLFIFVLSGIIPRVLALIRWKEPDNEAPYTTPLRWFYQHVCMPVSSDLRLGSLLYAVVMVAFYWLIAYLLDKRKIYIKV